ncbi:MAG: type I 3-dehydroquinate dehydratase, partial [Coriobacteriia bacterium]|nr:type I 3-dehydroquinate dehydratase [Coriobacteriia bacterium]
GGVLLGSCHDFDKTPSKEEIIASMLRMQEMGCDILKMATMPVSRRDVITLLAATEEMVSDHAKVPVVTMSMTGKGVVSRLVGEAFGSSITFGCFGKPSAPGQIDARTLDVVLGAIHEAL